MGELIFTFVLAFVYLSVTDPHAVLTEYFGFAIGMCAMVGGNALALISGGSLNPAVSLGVTAIDVLLGSGSLWTGFMYTVTGLSAGCLAALAYTFVESGVTPCLAHCPESGVTPCFTDCLSQFKLSVWGAQETHLHDPLLAQPQSPSRQLTPSQEVRHSPLQARGAVDFVFEPGTLGLVAHDWSSGIIDEVNAGQGREMGVREGWQMTWIDGQPYTEELLDAKKAGQVPYVVTFAQYTCDVQAGDYLRQVPDWPQTQPLHSLASLESSPQFMAGSRMQQPPSISETPRSESFYSEA